MSWAQRRGADREKLHDFAPKWTILVHSVVRCKLLMLGHSQWQEIWTKNKCNKSENFTTQVWIYYEQRKDQDQERNICKSLWNKN